MAKRRTRGAAAFIIVLLFIEFLDEFVFGVREAAWPLIRDDLNLTYAQIGLLLGVPSLVSSVVEPFLGVLGDVWKRRYLVLGGGFFFGIALLLAGASHTFILLLISFILFYPASGAFVSLSQATLMDIAPQRRQQNMARWAFAGSLGVVVGPLALSAAAGLNVGWRGLYFCMAALALVALVIAGRFSFGGREAGDDRAAGLKAGLLGALQALKRGEVLRWLTLLQLSDLMLDVLLGFLALYFVDQVGVSTAQASAAVVVWTVVGLVGDFVLIPLLEKVPGLLYLRVSAAAELLLFPAFLLVPIFWVKLVLLGLLGLFNAGWYSILKAKLYDTMPGQSGTVLAVSNIFKLVGGLLPIGLGLVAQQLDLGVTMWLLLIGPAALFLGLPSYRDNPKSG